MTATANAAFANEVHRLETKLAEFIAAEMGLTKTGPVLYAIYEGKVDLLENLANDKAEVARLRELLAEARASFS
jgi:hypothetical protein